MLYQKSRPLRIIFVGRLEKEKGGEILLDIIRRIGTVPYLDACITWKIVGDGTLLQDFKNLHRSNIQIFGRKNKDELQLLREQSDIAIVPSLFLETFGLVALESLTSGLPVIGPKKGGLIPFILDDLSIDSENPVNSTFDIIENIITGKITPGIINHDLFCGTIWKEDLKTLLSGYKKVLLVSDYHTLVGGVEHYISFLENEIRSLGITVETYGYIGKLTKLKRISLFFTSLFSFWRGISFSNKVKQYKPDLIWCHAIMRYHGIWTLRAMKQSGIDTYITHHDFGLIAARPSEIYNESDLPKMIIFSEFNKGTNTPLEKILRFFKFIYSNVLWYFLRFVKLHIVPSDFMKSYFQKYTQSPVIVFHHTDF